jgi:mercuric ion binding protein
MNVRALMFAAILGLGTLMSVPAFSAQQTIVLEVPGMSCPVCPVTVRKSLEKVPGVVKAVVTYEPKEAVVTYDDTQTTPEALMEATSNAGYPSTVKGARR